MKFLRASLAGVLAAASLVSQAGLASAASDGGYFADPVVQEGLVPRDLSVIDLSNAEPVRRPGEAVEAPWRPVDPSARRTAFPRIYLGRVVGWSKSVGWMRSDLSSGYDIHWTPAFGEAFVAISPAYAWGLSPAQTGSHGMACVIQSGSRVAVRARDAVNHSTGMPLPEDSVLDVVDVIASSTIVADPGCPVGFRGVVEERKAKLYFGPSPETRWMIAQSFAYSRTRSAERAIGYVNSALAPAGWREHSLGDSHDGSGLHGAVFDVPWDWDHVVTVR